MQQRSLGATGLKVSRLGLGTMTWGRDTDEHEARDQLIAFVEAGGTLVDTADVYGDGASEELIGTLLGDVVSRDEVVLATKAGISPAHGRARHRHLPRSPADRARRVPGAARRRPRRPVAGARLGPTTTPLEETLAALDLAVSSGRARYVGISNYTGWQTAQAATWQRAVPGRTPLASHAGRVLAAAARRRARGASRPRRRSASACCRGRRWAAACSPASTAPAPRPTRAAPPSTSPGSSAPTSTSAAAAIVEAVARAADGLGLVARSRCRWSGCATGRVSPPRSSAPGRPPSSTEPWASRS